MVGLFPSNAPGLASGVAVFEILIAVGLVVGFFLVRAGHVRAHRLLQMSMVLVNVPVVLATMVPPFLSNVLPGLPAEVLEPYYLLPTLAVVLGGAAEALGVYIVLVAGTNLVPARWRFRRYKLWMRTELVLWWSVVVLGLAIYVVWYAGPPAATWALTP